MNAQWFELFDKGVDRKGTECLKWDSLGEVFGNPDAIALWVADMDFPSPKEVREAIIERAKHGVFGYTEYGERHFLALQNWMKRRHGLLVSESSATTCPGVVDAMVFCLRALGTPGGKVAIQPPIYGPFYAMTEKAGFEAYLNPLRRTEKGWEMDLDNLEDGFKNHGVTVMLLCSPHNPAGRIWTRDELTKLVQLCNRYHVRILADEIHMDFEMPGYRHTPIHNIPGAEDAVILCSATKTFNIAGLRHSTIVAPEKTTREAIRAEMDRCMVTGPNLFGYIAQTAAYEHGDEWLDNLLMYLDGNRAFAEDFLRERLPEFVTTRLEGTYLKYIDMRALGMPQEEMMTFLSKTAGVALNDGLFFGEAGRGCVRMNLATPRCNLDEGLRRIEKAVRAR